MLRPSSLGLLSLALAACRAPNPAFQPPDDLAPASPDAAAMDAARADAAGADTRAALDLASGLVGWWKLDETSGTVARDSSGNGNDGTLEGLAARAGVAGRLDGALEIPSAPNTGGVKVPLSPSLERISRAFTLAAWVNRAGTSERFASALSRQLGTGPYDVYNLTFAGPELQVHVAPDPRGTSFMVKATRSPPAQRWAHVAATWDGATLRLFLDGAEVGMGRYAETLPRDPSPLYLGTNKNPSGGEPLGGLLDEVLLYDRALPAAGIAALAGGARPR